MEATESMQVLARAGRADDALNVVRRAADRASRSYDQIISDESRTEDYKATELEAVHASIRDDVARSLEKMARGARESEQRTAAKVFGTTGLSGDPASLAISRRDAADRAASAETSSDLRNLLDRANRIGDEVLARAVAERAFEQQDVDVLNAFLETRPHLDGDLQRLWDAQRQADNLSQSFGFTMELAALRPPARVR